MATQREEERATKIYNFLAGRGFGNLGAIAPGGANREDLYITKNTDPNYVNPVSVLTESVRVYMNSFGADFPPRIQRIIDRYGVTPPFDMRMLQLERRSRSTRRKDIEDKEKEIERDVKDGKGIQWNVRSGIDLKNVAMAEKVDWDTLVTPLGVNIRKKPRDMKAELLEEHEYTLNHSDFPKGRRFRMEFEEIGRKINGMTPNQILYLFGQYEIENFFHYITRYESTGDGINISGLADINRIVAEALSVSL